MLNGIKNGYVLNLFIFDENGNEIDDLVQDEPIVLTGKEFGEFDLTNKEGIAQLREVATSHLETMRDEWVDVPALAGKEESIAVQLR